MEASLREKIIELFEYRQLPELIRYNNSEWDNVFYEKLIDLQYHIYMLDHELETNWEVDLDIIAERWVKIYDALLALNIPKNQHDSYCRHIYKYQKHELDIREGKLPTRLSMEYFYFYKSCDVKLLRKIIYKLNPALSKVFKESQWRLFDLVTEINDDIEDIQEDAQTINGNRFLISIKLMGKQQTETIFKDFLNDISSRNAKTSLSFNALNIKDWTETQVVETIQLLESQLKAYDRLDTQLYDDFIPKNVALKF
ncbi:MAG: hypothetical protein P1U56_24940 [Saprospiraceae bacterium]|nr:hypothetical protein [Saprospiraceae bacterium]